MLTMLLMYVVAEIARKQVQENFKDKNQTEKNLTINKTICFPILNRAAAFSVHSNQ